jgi:hypothetical protein
VAGSVPAACFLEEYQQFLKAGIKMFNPFFIFMIPKSYGTKI